MCGISGILCYRKDGISSAQAVDRMTTAMASRGPDGVGFWQDSEGRVAFGHRRLSIIDLSSKSGQPMHSHDGRFVIVFNGEIYNYKELRESLVSKGIIFRTKSDTEVILEMFRFYGKGMLSKLRGMFAMAIWDNRESRLLLARDVFGIKPLYYSNNNKNLIFASQVKALVAGGVGGSPDSAAVVGFHLFGSIPEPFTYLESISCLPAGHFAEFSDGGLEKLQAYCLVPDLLRNETDENPSEQIDHALLHDVLLDSVRAHLVADVPVGLFLSAGIDSGALLGLMREVTDSPISTFTLAFDEFRGSKNDETTNAACVARLYGADHHVHYLTRSDFLSDLSSFREAMDQPSIDGLNTYFISKVARDAGMKIALSGVGGDEMFGGYPSFRKIPRDVACIQLLRLGRRAVQPEWSSLSHCGRLGWIEPKIEALLRYGSTYEGAYLARRCVFTPEELSSVMDRDLAIEGLNRLQPLNLLAAQSTQGSASSFEHVAILESTVYMRNQLLRDTDWAGMANSLEVRTPLVDSFLLSKLARSMRTGFMGIGKQGLASASVKPLPKDVMHRPKTGFSTPLPLWLQQAEELGDWRDNPVLRRKGTKWAKRWTFSVSRQFFGAV